MNEPNREQELCLFNWNPGVWPYAATCVQAKGHDGNHRTKTGRETEQVVQVEIVQQPVEIDLKPWVGQGGGVNHRMKYQGRHRKRGRK